MPGTWLAGLLGGFYLPFGPDEPLTFLPTNPLTYQSLRAGVEGGEPPDRVTYSFVVEAVSVGMNYKKRFPMDI